MEKFISIIPLKNIIIVIGVCLFQEFFIRSFFIKRKIRHFEKLTDNRESRSDGNFIIGEKPYKNEIIALRDLYRNIKFKDDQLPLKLEIAKLIFFYSLIISRLIGEEGIIQSSYNRNDQEETIILEKQKHQLESVLENLLNYIKENREDE